MPSQHLAIMPLTVPSTAMCTRSAHCTREPLHHSSPPVMDRLTNATCNWKRLHALSRQSTRHSQSIANVSHLHPPHRHPYTCLIATCCPTGSLFVSTGGMISSIILFPSRRHDGPRQQLQTTMQRLEKLAGNVVALRSMLLLQDKLLSPLVLKPVSARFKKHLQVLHIVGDGRCLLYALLHSRCAAPPDYPPERISCAASSDTGSCRRTPPSNAAAAK